MMDVYAFCYVNDKKEWKEREKRNPDYYNLSVERKPERAQFDSKK